MRIDFGEVVVDTGTREIRRAGRPVPLSPKAFELLLILIECRPQAVAKAALQDRLWPDTFVVEKNLANLVAEIRKAIGDSPASPAFLRTVPRFGYALRADDASARRATLQDASAVRVSWAHGQTLLPDGEHVVGRAPDVTISLADDSVSRRHARITVDGATATVEDLGSKNGTMIGERRITRATPLADGDRVHVGNVVLVVRLAGDVDSTRTATSHRTSSVRVPP